MVLVRPTVNLHEKRIISCPIRLTDILYIRLQDDDNKIDPSFIANYNFCLDVIEQSGDLQALITISDGSNFSLGVEKEFLKSLDVLSPQTTTHFFRDIHALFARILLLPAPSVAAMVGKAVDYGLLFACAHQFRYVKVVGGEGRPFKNNVKGGGLRILYQ